jgi:histone-lysine N-methyltransferase SETMAR
MAQRIVARRDKLKLVETGTNLRVLLETQKRVTAKSPRVFQAVKNIRPGSRADTWFFHHDDGPTDRSRVHTDYLLEHPPYSPDFAPRDFALFPYVKNRLKGRRFSNDEDLLRAWDDKCAQIAEEMWNSWFDDWFRRMQKCIECGGKYFERLLTYLLTYGSEIFLRSCQLCSPSRTPQHFMEPEGSIPCSQGPSTGPYPEPYQSNPLHPILSL